MAAGTLAAGERATLDEGRRASPRDGTAWLSYGVLAIPLAVGLVRIGLEPSRHIYEYGDQALIELAARAAGGGHQLLGPYSRFGYHHPGPAMFYLYGIPMRIFGDGARIPYVMALLFNSACALFAVALVRRSAGRAAGLWTAAVVALFALGSYHDLLRDTWNPYLITMPYLVFLLLAADLARGRLWAAPWLVGLGSFLAQTHLGTVPSVGGLGVVALGTLAWRRRRVPKDERTPLDWRKPAIATGVATAALWILPLSQQLFDSPGNIGQLADFFTSPHRPHPPRPAIALLGRALDGPLTRYRSILALPGAYPHGISVFIAVAIAAAVLVVARRRRAVYSELLALIVIAALAVGTLSLIDVAGVLLNYLGVFLSAIGPVLLVALGLTVLERPEGTDDPELPRAGWPALAALAVVPGLALLGQTATQPSIVNVVSRPDVEALWAVVQPALTSADRRVVVRCDGASLNTGYGVVLELVRDGRSGRVEADQESLFTKHYVAKGDETTEVCLSTDGSPDTTPHARVLGSASGMTISIASLGS